jgi:hypothetical protein
MKQSKIAEAAGSASAGASGAGSIIEAAMTQAIVAAAEAGITDPGEIRELMHAARVKAKAEL